MDMFGTSLQLLQNGMSAALLRQRTMAHNLANADTPGYKANRVSFEDRLQQALTRGAGLQGQTSDPRHLPIGEPGDPAQVAPEVSVDRLHAGRPDGNNVDLEVESAAIAGNDIWYSAMSRLANDEFHRLQFAISEGKR